MFYLVTMLQRPLRNGGRYQSHPGTFIGSWNGARPYCSFQVGLRRRFTEQVINTVYFGQSKQILCALQQGLVPPSSRLGLLAAQTMSQSCQRKRVPCWALRYQYLAGLLSKIHRD